MNWKRIRRLGYCLVLVCGVVLSGACGDDDAGVPEAVCVEFVPAEAPEAGKVAARAGAESTCEVAVVEIVATDIDDVFSIEADVLYDNVVVRYLGFDTEGSVLAADGVEIVPIVSEVEGGRITLGIARRSATGIDVSGTRLLVKLFFLNNLIAGSTGSLTLTDECLRGSEEPPDDVKPGLVCSDGTFIIN
jgi:hypothetical protein